MTRKTKLFIRALADHLRLRIKYVNDLPAKVPGFLDPSKASRTIVVNASKSKSDHAFTILHEVAHYILHYKRSHRTRLPWWLARKWKSKPMIRFSKTTKRIASRTLNDERQADLWAFCALFQIGATDDVLDIVGQYPEKNSTFWLSFVGCIYSGIKFRVKRAFRTILHPFSTFYSPSSG
jgi:hypothetical protein